MPIRMWNPEAGSVIYDSPACRTPLGRGRKSPTREDRLSIDVDLGRLSRPRKGRELGDLLVRRRTA